MSDSEGQLVSSPPEAAPAKPTKVGPRWFARRFPPDDPRGGMGPVHWKGWAAFALFAGAMIFAGLAFLILAIAGSLVLGLIAFCTVSGGALAALLTLVARKGDKAKTMEDYVKAKTNVVG